MAQHKGAISWNRGKHIQTNSGRTHFKKGIVPWNKGLTQEEYKSHFKNGMKGLFQKGRIISKETIEKQRLSHLGKKHKHLSEQARINMSNAHKGKKLSEEHKKKLREYHLRKPKSEKWLARNNKIRRPRRGYKQSEETKRKISESEKGKVISLELKKRLRLANIEYIKKTVGWMYPNIGRNEKKYLDELQELFKYNIKRQYECEGYFIDGYIEELKLAIEIDEKPKIKEKDIEREKIIRDKLNCEFLRIKDYD